MGCKDIGLENQRLWQRFNFLEKAVFMDAKIKKHRISITNNSTCFFKKIHEHS